MQRLFGCSETNAQLCCCCCIQNAKIEKKTNHNGQLNWNMWQFWEFSTCTYICIEVILLKFTGMPWYLNVLLKIVVCHDIKSTLFYWSYRWLIYFLRFVFFFFVFKFNELVHLSLITKKLKKKKEENGLNNIINVRMF